MRPPPSAPESIRLAYVSMSRPARGAFLGAWAWLCWGLVVFRVHAYDDVFISLRYADNLVTHGVYAFNPGEVVEGASNPLWVLLIAACRSLGADSLAAAKVMGACCSMILPWITLALTAAVAPGAPAFAGGWLAGLCAPLALWGVNGLETPAYTLAVTLGLLLAIHDLNRERGFPRAAPAFVVAAWLRPEGPLLAAPFLIAMAWQGRQRPAARRMAVLAWGIIVGGVAALVGGRLALFGSPVPNTFYAKITNPELSGLGDGFSYLLGGWSAAGGLPLACAMGMSVPADRRLWQRWALVAATVLAQGSFIWYSRGDWMAGFRFLLPVLPACFALAGAGAGWGWQRAGLARPGLRTALIAACAMWSVVHAQRERGGLELETRNASMSMYTGHRRVAAWLESRVPRGTLIALSDAGYIPWRTGLPTVDLLSLNNAFIARHSPTEAAEYVIALRRPGVLVMARTQARGAFPVDLEIGRHAGFRRGWTRSVSFPAGSYRLVVFLRRDLAATLRL